MVGVVTLFADENKPHRHRKGRTSEKQAIFAQKIACSLQEASALAIMKESEQKYEVRR